MTKHDLLHVGICNLESVQVIYKMCIFRHSQENHDKKIRQAFQMLREWTVRFGLEPKQLLHIGIPTIDAKQLIMYECCIEYPIPMMEDNPDIRLKTLTGGNYAVLIIEKTPTKIRRAIQRFHADYIPDNDLVLDEQRPTYEIYYEDTLEYCVPIFR
jgi:DNA gyrase inhibitor GyrI